MKKKYSFKALVFACLAGVLIAVAGVVLLYIVVFGGADSRGAASKFATMYHILDSQYVGQADMDAVGDAAYRAMVGAIGDRWSYYLTPEEYESYKEAKKGSYVGIGVTIASDTESGYLQVAKVAEGSPASRAGIKPGELLFAMDGQSLKDVPLSELSARMSERGLEKFELTVGSLDRDEIVERRVEIAAEPIISNPIEYYMLPDSIGYIKIKGFEDRSGSGAIEAVEVLTEQGAKALIFDVRNNPGGQLSELTEILDYLLPEGDIFVSVSEDGKETVTTSDERCVTLPMAVLVNSSSYSAAEFFAAALSEYEAAELVGTATTGKSRSQVDIPLPDGSAVHLSTRGYLTPKRVNLAEQGGLVPDHVIELSEEAYTEFLSGKLEPEDDGQIQKAVAIINRTKKCNN